MNDLDIHYISIILAFESQYYAIHQLLPVLFSIYFYMEHTNSFC